MYPGVQKDSARRKMAFNQPKETLLTEKANCRDCNVKKMKI